MFREATKEILRMVFPRRCPGCGDVIAADSLVCSRCDRAFVRVSPPFCMRCGRHVEDETQELCSECMTKEHSYSCGIAVFEYDGLMKKSMSNFKFNGWRENSEFYVNEAVLLASERIKAFKPDAIIPVPIHSSKRAARGFNQTEVIAESLGMALGIPVVKDFLLRTRKTGAMKKLDLESRKTNLGSAFSCNIQKYPIDDVKRNYKRVFLLDDIYTTGSTMQCCTSTLKESGVATVGIISIAIGRLY